MSTDHHRPDVYVVVRVIVPSTGTTITQNIAAIDPDGNITGAVSHAMNELRDLLIGQLGLVKRVGRDQERKHAATHRGEEERPDPESKTQ